MSLVRVTATLPPDLLKAADRLARSRRTSRSAVLAESLHGYLATQSGAGVADATATMSDSALLDELSRRLARPASPRRTGPESAGGLPFHVDSEQLAALCRRFSVRRLALFGSVLRADFGPDSDVDVLVWFEAGRTPGLAFVTLAEELGGLFGGRRVDLLTEKSLHALLRDDVLAEARTLYAA